MARIDNDKIVKELKRELVTRKYYYPKWIVAGTITKEVADHRIKVMEQLIEDYEKKEDNQAQLKLL